MTGDLTQIFRDENWNARFLEGLGMGNYDNEDTLSRPGMRSVDEIYQNEVYLTRNKTKLRKTE